MALAVSLFSTGTASPFFVPTFLLAVMSMAFGRPNGDLYAGAWMAAILYSAFLISPVEGYANTPVVLMLLLCPMIGMTAGQYAQTFCTAVLGAFACMLIWQYFFAPELMYHGKRAAWPLLDPNNAGALMAVGAIVAPFYALPVFLVAMLCTGSKSAFLALIVAYGVLFMIFKPRKAVVMGCVVICVIILLFFTDGFQRAVGQRLEIWQAVLPVIDWKGYGIGTFHKLYPAFRQESTTTGFFIHNDYLQIAFGMGWLMLPFFLVFVLAAFRKITTDNIKPVAGFLAICIIALVNYPFFVPPVAIMAGVLYASKNRCYDKVGMEAIR